MHRYFAALTLSIPCLLPRFAEAARPTDISVQLLSPGPVLVGAPGRYEVVVENVSRRRAQNVRVQIHFPLTATSPRAYILGEVTGADARCYDDGTVFECVLGHLRRGRSTRIGFDFTAAHSAVPGEIRAVASTTNDTDLGNNEASAPVELVYYTQPLSPPAAATVTFCSGQGLIAFYDCVVSPGSTGSYPLTLEVNGTVSFPGRTTAPTGTWSQSAPEDLHIEFTSQGRVVMSFDGKAIGGACFDGLATFSSPYNAAYRVCF